MYVLYFFATLLPRTVFGVPIAGIPLVIFGRN